MKAWRAIIKVVSFCFYSDDKIVMKWGGKKSLKFGLKVSNTRPSLGDSAVPLGGPLVPVIPRPRRAAPLQSQSSRWIRWTGHAAPPRNRNGAKFFPKTHPTGATIGPWKPHGLTWDVDVSAFMVGHLAPVPLSRRNVCLLHQKSPRHDQLTPARLTGTLGDINRLLTAAPGAEGKGPEQETPKLEEARSLLPLPLCTFLLVSQGAIINPFFLLPTHLPLSRFYPPENKKKKKSNASEQVSPLRCATRTGIGAENHLTVCACGTWKWKTKTHDTPITLTQSTWQRWVLISAGTRLKKQETDGNAHARQK